MLVSLRIKNLALVEDLTLELQPGFNAVTGETGAGKSILIGALSLVLGERASKGLIRSGADNCTVEAVFDLGEVAAPIAELLEENGLEPCEGGLLLLKRSFTAAGTNRQFVNGSPTTLTNLAAIGDWLVDMHGPHDHQSLLHASRQLALLDAYGGLESQVDDLAERVARRADLEQAKADLVIDEQTYTRQLDLLRFQVGEIESAKLDPSEEESLEADYQRATNAAELQETAQIATAILDDEEDSLFTRFGQLGQQLQLLERTDAEAASLTDLHGQAASLLRELQSELSSYLDRVDLDPAALHELEQRFNTLQTLKRKYGPELVDVIEFGREAAEKLAALESRDGELERINGDLARLDTELEKHTAALTKARRKILKKLGGAVVEQLRDLGFKQSHFEVGLSATPHLTATGRDRVEFQFAPNVGEPPQPLRAIASSGEMARVMLAIKTVLAAQDRIPLLVFDEVDANVGGETAHVVGEKMKWIANNRQVLCITHLPQVAAAANRHYLVAKHVESGRTLTEITPLEEESRIAELARMLGGDREITRQHARELLSSR
ncbi:MAG: DNA repair protein RecN [Verrucomicrobiae bacterium]|nr:DNA repair protein RecN [Verrucomicrobiae bacterium]